MYLNVNSVKQFSFLLDGTSSGWERNDVFYCSVGFKLLSTVILKGEFVFSSVDGKKFQMDEIWINNELVIEDSLKEYFREKYDMQLATPTSEWANSSNIIR